MFPFLDWYFPWSRLDLVLKAELLVWLGALLAALWIPFRTFVLKRTWLTMNHLPEFSEQASGKAVEDTLDES